MTEITKEEEWVRELDEKLASVTEEKKVALRLMEASASVCGNVGAAPHAICPFCSYRDPLISANIEERESCCLLCDNTYRVIISGD